MAINTTLIAVRNPKWETVRKENGDPEVNEDGTNKRFIYCDAKWSHLGDSSQEWLPFAATPWDPEQHGRDLFAAISNGDHGAIADED